jgi:hypothetical protein
MRTNPEPRRPPKVRVWRACRGLKSVARAEGVARNRGGPESPCRTNCEGQAGRAAQRQEAPSDPPGVGLAHSIQPQGASSEAGEGANKSTQSAQATSPVRTTEQDWPTFLRAIAEKAFKNKHHRFGDLHRWLNQEVLRRCFNRWRKDAASGVDGVTFHDAMKDLTDELQLGGHNFVVEVAADKTKTLRCGHKGGPHNGRFDFLGFEFYWQLDRQGKPEGHTTHGRQEMAGRNATAERMDQNTPSPEAGPDHENAQGQASRDVELRWTYRPLSPKATLPPGDPPDAAQVAQPAEPADEPQWAGAAPTVDTLPDAATAHGGRKWQTKAWPKGVPSL